eukprot:scaffold65967_cov98-Cyclotella_meneghiniana.AAC.4
MSNPPPPPNTWPLQPNQPFYIHTAFGPAIYNPSTGVWCPVFAAQAPQATPFPPPAQLNLLTPAVNPPSAAASPSSPPRQPSTSAVPQSTYTPTDDMVEALEALSREKWKMKTALRPQQVLACATLHEDKASEGIVLNVDRTGGGKCKSHTMRLSCAYEGAIGIVTIPLLALTASIQSKMEGFDPTYGPVNVIHLDEHCSDKQSLRKVISILNGVKKDTGRTIIVLTSPHGRGGSGDSPSTGVPSGASWAVVTACLTAIWAVGVGNGGGGSGSAMVSPCGGR